MIGERKLATVAAAAALVCVAAAWSRTAAATASGPGGRERTEGAPEAPAAATRAEGFDHGRHVSDVWLTDDEVARDCQGCHDYSAPDPAERRRPAEACEKCHAFDSMEFPRGSYLDPADEAASVFDHFDHRVDADGEGIDCKSCHDPASTTVPAVMPVPRGASVALCADCHGTDRAGFNRAIADRLAERSGDGGERRFRHADHLPPGRMDDAAECAECHTKVYRTDADNLGERQFDESVCSRCHEAEIAVEPVRRPSRTAASFLHWDHLSNPDAQEHPELAGRDCTACHAWDAERETFGLGPRFARGVYEGCITCHSERDVAALGGVHGEVSDCVQCHRIEEESLSPSRARSAENRPRELLPRPRPVAFELEAHPHPFVTSPDGSPLDEDCSSCHLARVPAIPSQVDGEPFDHRTHLPGRLSELTAGDCKACHANVGGESFSDLEELEELAARWTEAGAGTGSEARPELPEGLALFEREACERCHSEAIRPVPGDSPLREVAWFSHRAHLNRYHPGENRPFTCTDCHVVATADGGFDVRVGETYRNCTECHGHTDHPETTGGFGADLVRACFECHRVGVPRADEPVLVGRRTASIAPGSVETHDNEGECRTCHRGTAEDEALWQEPRERTLLARKLSSPHAVDTEYSAVGAYLFNERVSEELGRLFCIDCHWEWDALDLPKKVTNQFLREDYARTESGNLTPLLELRRRFGDDLAHFPGFSGSFRPDR